MRDAIFNRIFSGVTLDPADEANAKANILIWCEEILNEMKNFMDIELEAGDITDSAGDTNEAVTLTGKLK